MYTALVLDEFSRELLLSKFTLIKDQEPLAHHMTVCMGSSIDKYPGLLGQSFDLQVITVAQSLQVVAVGVKTDCPSSNARKHITVCVNRALGGKPVMSNNLTEWKDWAEWKDSTVLLHGTVKECQ